MSVLLWYGPGDNDAISVGSLLHVGPAFREVAQVLGDAPGFEELQSVPGFAEQQVTPWWLGQVRQQAVRFLHERGHSVTDATSRLLGQLAAHIEHAGMTNSG